ncbi:hypothetical protein V2P24_02605 [Mycoplasma putrefaciens]|uniref:hypothetical protein n=1 Tax=Mycoplasma putrefaciens TaxID=2123 RepID=UPI003DA6C053
MKLGFIEEEHEIALSIKRCLELWDSKLLDTFEIGTFKGLSQIHAYIFQDVFEFAGQIRKVNISKDGFMFAQLFF